MRQRYQTWMMGLLSCGMAMFLSSCKDADDLVETGSPVSSADIIRVGGVSTDYLVATATTTRSGDDKIDEETITKTDAENVSWLIDPLKNGMNITYGLSSNSSNILHAQLKLLTDEYGNIKYSTDGETGNAKKYAEYSFKKYNGNTLPGDDAKWLGNGRHFFQGVFVPDEIKTNAGNFPDKLTTDQHTAGTTAGSLGNYTLLSRYLAMPSNFTLNATVARVKLPFRHRLARVLAYILIDPAIGTGVTLQGYKQDKDGNPTTDEDPTTTKISFSNVEVLKSVTESGEGNIKTYTPQWTTARKAVPHFVGERGSYDESDLDNPVKEAAHFIAYYDVEKSTYIYPTDAAWDDIHEHATFTNDATTYKEKKYTRTLYGTVPVYDLIVRPTYSSLNNVMYDEANYDNSSARRDLYVKTNQIDFELSLSNGLHYTKKFTFDLDANYQTVVYLHISRERVDYNSSGSDLWVSRNGEDDYYGVNNQNGNTLSYAGSSWQRAYTNKDKEINVTDGHKYQADDEDQFAQYVSDDKWIEMFIEAYEGGRHHGDYFILDRDIEIPAAAFPNGFVFTGHLDGQDHTITITGNSYTKVTYHGTDVSEEVLPGKSAPYYLFGGLNGKYSTPQESDMSATWEANVHKENGKWVPYTNGTDGWRAELINTNFRIDAGCSVFQTSAVYGTDITGYLHNCWVNSTYNTSTHKWTGTRIKDYIPAIPEY